MRHTNYIIDFDQDGALFDAHGETLQKHILDHLTALSVWFTTGYPLTLLPTTTLWFFTQPSGHMQGMKDPQIYNAAWVIWNEAVNFLLSLNALKFDQNIVTSLSGKLEALSRRSRNINDSNFEGKFQSWATLLDTSNLENAKIFLIINQIVLRKQRVVTNDVSNILDRLENETSPKSTTPIVISRNSPNSVKIAFMEGNTESSLFDTLAHNANSQSIRHAKDLDKEHAQLLTKIARQQKSNPDAQSSLDTMRALYEITAQYIKLCRLLPQTQDSKTIEKHCDVIKTVLFAAAICDENTNPQVACRARDAQFNAKVSALDALVAQLQPGPSRPFTTFNDLQAHLKNFFQNPTNGQPLAIRLTDYLNAIGILLQQNLKENNISTTEMNVPFTQHYLTQVCLYINHQETKLRLTNGLINSKCASASLKA